MTESQTPETQPQLKPFDPDAFTDEERQEMYENNHWVCPYCKHFAHNYPTGPTWKAHFAVCRIIKEDA